MDELDSESMTEHGGDSCDPNEIGIKSFFLGPQAENAEWVESTLRIVLHRWFEWRRGLFPGDGKAISVRDQQSADFAVRRSASERALETLLDRFEAEVPKFSPRYVGHMFSEISLPALLGHVVALIHNPNNVSGESSRVGIGIEDEAIAMLAKMLGLPEGASGHFTSGGTVANFEALVRARERLSLWMAVGLGAGAKTASLFSHAHCGWKTFDTLLAGIGNDSIEAWRWPGKDPYEWARKLDERFGIRFRSPVVIVPDSRHYSWEKGVALLGLGEESLWKVALDARGRLRADALALRIAEARRQNRPVMMVVSVAGTTELGAVDPVSEVQDLLDSLRSKEGISIWHHVDAAYGGFFATLDRSGPGSLSESALTDIRAIGRADSVTLDPHKLGYVPYASGAFICRDPRDYTLKAITAPYVDFDPKRDRGPFTLEGSRSAAGAVATWLTGTSIGFSGGGYGRIIERTIQTRVELESALLNSKLPIQILPGSDSNILCFSVAHSGEPLSAANARTLKIVSRFNAGRESGFHVAKTILHRPGYDELISSFARSWSAHEDCGELAVIRMCLLNPFFGSREPVTSYPEAFIAELARHIAEEKN